MKISLKIKKEYDVKYLQLKVTVRYWEDATLYKNIILNPEECGENDEDHEIPCNDGNIWFPKIDVDTGEVVNWIKGIKAEIHYKVCDEGIYELLDKDNNIIFSHEGYVPSSILGIDDDSFGDYICITIDENGFIKNWDPDLEQFVSENYDDE